MEAQHIAVFDGVGDGVGVQLLLEDVGGGLVACLLAFDLLVAGILLKNRRAGKSKQLGVGEEILDRLVVVAELRAVAFVKDKDHTLLAQRFQTLLVVALVRAILVAVIQRKAELLDGGDDDLVGIVVGEQTPYKRFGVGVLLDAAFLKLIEFFPRLPVEVFAIDHEQALVDIRVVLEQGGGLERGEGLAAAGGVPDVAVASALVDAVNDRPDGIDLIGPHDHKLLFAGDQHHVAADHLAQGALGEEAQGEVVEMGDLAVVDVRELVKRQEALGGVEAEVTGVVAGEVPGIAAVADDEELQETEQGFAVAIAGVVLVIDDLLHGPTRADLLGFQLDLHHRHTVDEQDHIIAVMAVIGADAELIDDLEVVFAPILDINQGVVERRAVVALEAVALAQVFGGREHIRGDDGIEQAGKFAVGEMDAVQRLEMLAEVGFQRGAVVDVLTVGVFELDQFFDQGLFDVLFSHLRTFPRSSPNHLPDRADKKPARLASFDSYPKRKNPGMAPKAVTVLVSSKLVQSGFQVGRKADGPSAGQKSEGQGRASESPGHDRQLDIFATP